MHIVLPLKLQYVKNVVDFTFTQVFLLRISFE